jgi:peptide/nickel transport system permease protein
MRAGIGIARRDVQDDLDADVDVDVDDGGGLTVRLIGRRLTLYALTFWVAITVNFLLPHFIPGNPIQTMIGKLTGQVPSAEIRAIRLSFGGGLDKPLLSQYFTYIGQLVHGNLGYSLTVGASVSKVLEQSVPWTIGLIGVSLIISFLGGTLCGALLGWTRGSRLDSLIPTATFSRQSRTSSSRR